MKSTGLPFAIMPVEAFMDQRLTLTQYRVLGALLSFRGRDTGVVWPSREALSARTGLPVAKISYATTALCRLGWLTKEGCGGRSRSCHYRITVPAELTTLAESALNDDQNTVPESGTVYQNTVPESGTVNPLNGTRIGYETVPESGRGIEETKKRPERREEGTPPKQAPTQQARGARLSLSALPPDWWAWAKHERPDLDPYKVWERFSDHWAATPGSRGCKSDWLATWRNWVRRENSTNKGNNYAKPQSRIERTQSIMQELAIGAGYLPGPNHDERVVYEVSHGLGQQVDGPVGLEWH
jgi:Helix-turn-helix domain